MTPPDIIAATGLKPPQVRYAHLKDLVARGLIVKEGKAYRKIPTKPGDEALPAAEPTGAAQAEGKRDGLPRPQVRVLKALADSAGPLTRAEVAAKAQVSSAIVAEAIGRFDSEARAKRDKELGRKSLLSQGFVKVVEAGAEDGGGRAQTRLEISDAGREALAAAWKDMGGNLPPVQAGPTKAEAKE